MTTKSYDARLVTLSVAGRPIVSGFADGDFVKISYDADAWTDKAGTDGEIVRSKTNDKRCSASVMLMQTSDGNDLLSQLAAADDAAPNGAGVGEFILRDQTGRTLVRGPCWVQKKPEVARGREAGTTEWKIRVVANDFFVGGSVGV